ncbi:hypothetical protein C2U72_03630 [Prosthecomicrobium hirschii]|uniref:phosphoribosyltransferase n=1 Tax=Prosthecodimorpha hirschii TaxID=665126 RepID=UPI0011270EF5|nr:phosphoribosyltransferase [Prosthecomicrobium hirschii]TPQ52345.1 hypothetical protein C2U72_03630 [Prosthecomicrobium hirschii]
MSKIEQVGTILDVLGLHDDGRQTGEERLLRQPDGKIAYISERLGSLSRRVGERRARFDLKTAEFDSFAREAAAKIEIAARYVERANALLRDGGPDEGGETLLAGSEAPKPTASSDSGFRKVAPDMLVDLAKFCRYVTERRPDAVVGLDRGGLTLVKLVADQCHDLVNCAFFELSRTNGELASMRQIAGSPIQSPRRFVVLDDIARGGETISRASEYLTEKYPSLLEMQAVVLVSSRRAQDRLKAQNWMFHAIRVEAHPKLDWENQTGEFQIKGSVCILGSPPQAVAVPRRLVSKVY